MSDAPKDLIPLKEACRIGTKARGLPLWYRTIYRWHEAGLLQIWKIGKRAYVSLADLNRVLSPQPRPINTPTRTPAQAKRDLAFAQRELDRMGIPGPVDGPRPKRKRKEVCLST